MSRTGTGQSSSTSLTGQLLGGYRSGGHDGTPLIPFGVTDPDRDGIAEGLPVTESRDQLQLIGFEGHPGPSPHPEATTSQLL